MLRVMAVACLLTATPALGQPVALSPYKLERNIQYRSGNQSDYMRQRCRLDVYYPRGESFATVVWFHGGGLKKGERSVPDELRNQGIAVVAVNYRFSPKVKSPAYVEDAAAAVAWTIKNIAKFGGDPKRVFVSGHSAGGYLTSMVGLDKSYLAAFGEDADTLAGLIPLSGHTITHFTVREERGIDGKQPVLDSMAPLFSHSRRLSSHLAGHWRSRVRDAWPLRRKRLHVAYAPSLGAPRCAASRTEGLQPRADGQASFSTVTRICPPDRRAEYFRMMCSAQESLPTYLLE